MMLTRRHLLGSLLAPAFLPASALAFSSPKPKRLLVVMCEGGWDVTYCLDPKLGLGTVDGPIDDQNPTVADDVESVETFSGIPVLVNDAKRPAVRTFFQAWSHDVAVLNGIWVGAIAHATARVRILTGTQRREYPAWATIAGSAHGQDLPLGSVDLSGGSYMGKLAASSGQIGIQSQIKTLIDDASTFPSVSGSGLEYPLFRADRDDRDALYAHLQVRNQAMRAQLVEQQIDPSLLDSRLEASMRANRFRNEGLHAISGLSLGITPSFQGQLDLAVELLQTDLCRAVTVDSGCDWDTHGDNSLQHDNYQSLFLGLDRLAQSLVDKQLWDDTLVVVVSEMTRTPTFNSTKGKDHWPHASFLMFGGRTIGGRTYGGTDDRVESQRIDLSTGEVTESGDLNKYDNISAGILAALDVDPEPWYPTIRPFTACFS